MSKYIDAERLRMEIESLDENARKTRVAKESTPNEKVAAGGQINLCQKLYLLINSLQQEQQEVGLEEITKFSRIKQLPDGFDKDWLKYYHIDKEYNSVRFHHLSTLEREYIIARHFYELGKNSK